MSMTETTIKAMISWFEARKGKTLKLNNKGVDFVVKALDELNQYRAIGTVSEFRELKEKATAKSPAYQGEHEKCPTCGSFCIGEHCIKCGQRILCD